MMMQLMRKNETYIKKWMIRQHCKCVIKPVESESAAFDIFSTDLEHIDRLSHLINTEFDLLSIELSSTRLLDQKRLNDLLQKLTANQEIVVATTEDAIKFYGLKPKIEEIQNSFIKLVNP